MTAPTIVNLLAMPMADDAHVGMNIDVSTLPPSLTARLQPLLAEAERAGCSLVRVALDRDRGFAALIEWPAETGGSWEMQAAEFSYLLGHLEQAVGGLTP